MVVGNRVNEYHAEVGSAAVHMADVMTSPSESPADAQAAAAARKARRKKTRWGADVEPAQEAKGIAQAGSTEIPTVTSLPGSAFTASARPQQELSSLKLNSSVPSGTLELGQLSSASASGQAAVPASAGTHGLPSTASAVAPPPWYAGFLVCLKIVKPCLLSPVCVLLV